MYKYIQTERSSFANKFDFPVARRHFVSFTHNIHATSNHVPVQFIFSHDIRDYFFKFICDILEKKRSPVVLQNREFKRNSPEL